MSESQYIPDPDELEDDAAGEQDELYEHYSITADRGQSPLRLDKFLTIHMERCSRNRIQTAADAGNILVNGKPAKSSYKVKPGDRISLVMPYPKREIEIIPENIPLEIPYEDDDLLLVNKPAGMVVHPGHGNYSATLDLRRPPLQRNMILRHKMAQEIRRFLSDEGFLEIETPYLVNSTPEGARDFVVPSRMSPNQFYALPQSPQTLKQLLMVAGYDKYFQIVRCFRDEDLRADRQPEFTQIDCEMSFVEQEDVLEIFERWAKHMFREVMGIELTEPLRRMPWIEAMEKYGSDKPDLRFGMEFADLTDLAQGHGFAVFDDAEYVTGFAATGCAGYTRKQIDALTEFVKRQQIGAKGLVWIRVEADGNVKSSVDKFYSPEQVRAMAERAGAKAGDLVLILCGKKFKTLTQLCALRLEVAQQLGLRDPKKFAPLWVIDFPLFEWDDETQRYYAVHHPFTSPKLEDVQYLDSDPGRVRANAYDFVCNGTEIGGGSIRIHDSKLQAKMFELLGFTAEQAQERFGFLMNAFKYGAPPHGGLAFGFDRLCSLFGGSESIRDYIAFPKNNNGRDMMLDAPGYIDQAQLDELYLQLVKPEE